MERSYNKYAILSSNINYLLNYFLEKLLCNYRTTQGFFNSPTATNYIAKRGQVEFLETQGHLTSFLREKGTG
jgi:hypothetical protein